MTRERKRKRKKKNDCALWTGNGQCLCGQTCTFKHDLAKNKNIKDKDKHKEVQEQVCHESQTGRPVPISRKESATKKRRVMTGTLPKEFYRKKEANVTKEASMALIIHTKRKVSMTQKRFVKKKKKRVSRSIAKDETLTVTQEANPCFVREQGEERSNLQQSVLQVTMKDEPVKKFQTSKKE